MIRALFLYVIAIFATSTAIAQAWSETFNGTLPLSNVTLNTTDQGSAGTSGDNVWVINSDYGNVGVPQSITPSQPAGITNNPVSQYLHVTSVISSGGSPSIASAIFDSISTGINAESYFTVIQTGLNTTTVAGSTMNFWFLNGSSAGTAKVFARDGSAGPWVQLNPIDFSVPLHTTSNWTNVSYSGVLLDGMVDVQLGFQFTVDVPNEDMLFPSFAIDDLEIDTPFVVNAQIQSPNPLPTWICEGEQINFVADQTNPNVTVYNWNWGGANNGSQTASGATATLNPIASGPTGSTHTITLTISDGVTTSSTSFQLFVNPCNPPTINISGSPTTICNGNTVSFTDGTIPGSSPITGVQWFFPGGTPTNSTSTTPTITYNTPGVYDVYYQVTDTIDTYYDTLFDYVEVQSCPPPIAGFQASATVLCPGDCIFFVDQSANMGASGAQWLWFFPGSDSTTSTQQNPTNICYRTPGVYDVTLIATNTNGSDTLVMPGMITVDSCLPPTAGFDVEENMICEGTCVQFINQSTGFDSLRWQFFGADGLYQTSTDVNPIVCYSDVGLSDVQLIAYNEYGASIEYEVEYISVGEFPEVQASEDTSVFIGNSVKIFAYGTAADFVWSPASSLSCSNCRETYANPTENTWYYVTNISDHGCESTDSLRVGVRQEYYKGVPDIFSPNGDGENDVLYLYGNGITYVEFYVYDRYGRVIFETRDQEIGWDGTVGGEPAAQGVYVYFAKVTHYNGYQEIIQGDVTLIR